MKARNYFIAIQLLFFSCTIEKNYEIKRSEDKAIDNSLLGCVGAPLWSRTTGLYLEHNDKVMMNLCYFEPEYCLNGEKQLRNPISIEILKKLENELPQFKVSYTGDTIKIAYNLLDSIPFVFYEITDLKNNFEKTVGKAYLLYENYDIGNFGYRVLVTDTTESYGSFILETIMDEYLHKSWNENLSFNRTLEIKNEKIGKLVLVKVAPPYRVILPSEVLKR
ncbi:MAG: hypothetical protein SFU27_12170 [Thermonemataceae bacterium]|nr:hypothetical protein [Thermonemataceae bacterium]